MIGEVLQHYGAYYIKKLKGWQSIHCPFHLDDNASASVNIDVGGFKCHGCGMSGDAAKIVMNQEGLPDRASAFRWIETELGISDSEVREQSESSRKLSNRKRVQRGRRSQVPPRRSRKPYSWS